MPLYTCRLQCQLDPSMDTYRAPKPKQPDHADADDDDSDELGVFAAERYFYGDDALVWPTPGGRSSSSLSSSAFRTGTTTHEHDRSSVVPTPTAVTSSSEASWNSRSALLLPNDEPSEKSFHAVVAVAAAAAATPVIIGARPSDAEGQPAGRITPTASSSSSSNLRRWLLGVAACACAAGASEESSVSADDEMETSEQFPGTENLEVVTAARVTPRSDRWLLDGDKATLAGIDGHRRATSLGELPTPILHPQATATSDSDERRRVDSLETFRAPLPVRNRGSAFGSATQNSAFTIVAGGEAGGGGGTPGPAGEDDDAAPSELGCAYPPSEASVVWSVVTADGAASGNFSSAASGYYYHYSFNDVDDDGAAWRATARNTHNHKRRSGIPGGSSLLTCIRDKAVDAVGPAPSVHRQEVQPPAAAIATLGACGGGRNGHGVYKPSYQDVIRRR